MTNGKEILYSRVIMGTWQDISSIICKVTTSQLCRHPSPWKMKHAQAITFVLHSSSRKQQQFCPCEENSNTYTLTCSSMFLFSSSFLQTFHLKDLNVFHNYQFFNRITGDTEVFLLWFCILRKPKHWWLKQGHTESWQWCLHPFTFSWCFTQQFKFTDLQEDFAKTWR